tara:strand:- start:936 stop:1610 length:675 start_codon:yes stop_codon:yes gene_type:complete
MATASKSIKNATKVVNKTMGNLMSNKYFLYFVLFLAITSLLGYLQKHNFNAIVFFVLVGFLTYYFSKNMIIVLLTAIIATAFYGKIQNLYHPSHVNHYIEGMENKKDDDGDDEGMDHDGEEGMEDDDDEDEGMVGSSKVDYEKTLTDSYKNLNNMIGGEGMQRMTKDTERLMATQKELAKNMENMKPMLENAQNMIKGMGSLDIKGLGKMMNQLGGLGPMRGKA